MRVVGEVERGGGQGDGDGSERYIIFCCDTDKILCVYGFV